MVQTLNRVFLKTQMCTYHVCAPSTRWHGGYSECFSLFKNLYIHSAYYALSVCRIPGQLICGLVFIHILNVFYTLCSCCSNVPHAILWGTKNGQLNFLLFDRRKAE